MFARSVPRGKQQAESIRFDVFWSWLEARLPELRIAQTGGGKLVQQEGLHWWAYSLPDGGARASLVYGKQVVGTVVFPIEAAEVRPEELGWFGVFTEAGEQLARVRVTPS